MASQEQRMAGWESYGAQRKLAGRARSYEMAGYRLRTPYKMVAGGWLSSRDSLQNGGWKTSKNTGITGKSYSDMGITTVG